MKKLEVKPTEDEFESFETSRWGNKDVYPIPHDKRIYSVYAFVSYWGKINHCPPYTDQALTFF
jgi:NCS1 family nucleobase:cation symporter-1